MEEYSSNCNSEKRFVANKWDLSDLKSADKVSRRFGFHHATAGLPIMNLTTDTRHARKEPKIT